MASVPQHTCDTSHKNSVCFVIVSEVVNGDAGGCCEVCQPDEKVDCRETAVEIGLVILFVILAATTSYLFLPALL